MTTKLPKLSKIKLINYLYGSFPHGIKDVIEYRYFSKYCNEVGKSSFMATLLWCALYMCIVFFI